MLTDLNLKTTERDMAANLTDRQAARQRVRQRVLRQVRQHLDPRSLLSVTLIVNVAALLVVTLATGNVSLIWGAFLLVHGAGWAGVRVYERAIEAEVAREREQKQLAIEQSKQRLFKLAEDADITAH
jgi:hypothetical protein